MSEAAAAKGDQTPRVTELNVSGHLMTLDTGLFCIIQTPAKGADQGSGLPGVRLSVPPGPASRPESIQISGFRDDGWLSGFGDAALVRVTNGPAQVLVTIYQAPSGRDTAPSLQVLKLLDHVPPAGGQVAAPVPMPAPASQHVPGAGSEVGASQQTPTVMDMIAHVQGRGDVGALLGEWLGERGSKRWIEGFAVAPSHDVPAHDVEYQAVLGRGWLSPWAEGGQFCGSRGMALPVLGLRLRLRGPSAQTHECVYSASFTDGTEVGPVRAGEACEAESLAPMESFRIEIHPRQAAAPAPAAAKPAVPAPQAPASRTRWRPRRRRTSSSSGTGRDDPTMPRTAAGR